jgi:hypothetical protein
VGIIARLSQNAISTGRIFRQALKISCEGIAWFSAHEFFQLLPGVVLLYSASSITALGIPV